MYLKDINLKCFEKNDSSVSTPWIYAVLLRFQSRLKDHINIIPMKSIIQFLIHFFFSCFYGCLWTTKTKKWYVIYLLITINISSNPLSYIYASFNVWFHSGSEEYSNKQKTQGLLAFIIQVFQWIFWAWEINRPCKEVFPKNSTGNLLPAVRFLGGL